MGWRAWIGGKEVPVRPAYPAPPAFPPFLPQEPVDRHAERHAGLSSRRHRREACLPRPRMPHRLREGAGLPRRLAPAANARAPRTRSATMAAMRAARHRPRAALPLRRIRRRQRRRVRGCSQRAMPRTTRRRSKSGLQKSGLQEGKEEGGRWRRRRGYLAQESRRRCARAAHCNAAATVTTKHTKNHETHETTRSKGFRVFRWFRAFRGPRRPLKKLRVC